MSEVFPAGRRGGSKTQARLNRGMEDLASGRAQRQASGAGVQPGTGRQPLQQLATNLELEPHLWPTHRLQPHSRLTCSQVQPKTCSTWGAPEPPASPPSRTGDDGTCCCLVGEVHSTCKKDQSTPNLPSFARATPGGVKQSPKHSRASTRLGMTSQILSGASLPGPTGRTGFPSGPSPAWHQVLPGPCSRNHSGRPLAQAEDTDRDPVDLY